MLIYVQSRGISQDEDYRWLKIKQESQVPEIPQILRQPIYNQVKVTDLIDSKTPSIVLLRRQKRLFLLVTGLKANSERTDFKGRTLRNSVLWSNLDNETLIRSLIVLALRGELEKEIDKTVKVGGEYGFDVDFDKIHLVPNLLEVNNNINVDEKRRYGKNSESVKQELSLELESNLLPNREGFLVVITSIKTEASLREAGVWRGLSNRIESECLTPATSSWISEKKTTVTVVMSALISLVTLILLYLR